MVITVLITFTIIDSRLSCVYTSFHRTGCYSFFSFHPKTSMSRTLWIGDVQDNWTEDYLCALMRNASMVNCERCLIIRRFGVNQIDARSSNK